MTTETKSQAIMAAVYHAFHRADPCHCHEEAKLSEGEVLAVFIKKGLLDVADTPHQDALSIGNLRAAGAISYGESQMVKALGVTHLPELRFWTRHQVLRTSSFGAKKVDDLERLAAKFGVLLADGDPALLEEVKQDGEIESEADEYCGLVTRPRTVPQTPDEIRLQCMEGLLKLSQKLLSDGASLARHAGKLVSSEGSGRQAGALRRYVTNRQVAAAQVRTIAQPFYDLVDAEMPRRPTKRDAVAEPNNVVALRVS